MFTNIKLRSHMAVYTPALHDGVALNILPLQEAGILSKAKVV